jgi:hypothetical protein
MKQPTNTENQANNKANLLVVLCIYLLTVLIGVLYAFYKDAVFSGLSGADEPAHFVNSLLIYTYVTEHLFENPIEYARELYLHYPKVGLGHWPPVFYVLASSSFAGFPVDTATLIIFSIFVASLPVMPLSIVFLRLADWRIALYAALIYSASIATLESQKFLMLDQAIAAISFMGLLVWWQYVERERWITILAYGVLAGIAILIKGNGWVMGLFPIIHILITRRFSILIKPRVYVGAVLAMLVIAPWYYVARNMMGTGFRGEPGLIYALGSLWSYLELLVRNYGIALCAAALYGVYVGLVKAARGSDKYNIVSLCVALIAAVLVLQAIVPVANHLRYLAPITAPLVVLAVVGVTDLLYEIIPVKLDPIRAVLLLASLALFAAPGIAYVVSGPSKVDMKMKQAADLIMQEPNSSVIMVDGSSGTEGGFIAEMAATDRLLTKYVIKSSDVFAESDFTGSQYELKVSSEVEVLERLRAIGIDTVVIGRNSGSFPHSELLFRALEQEGSGYEQVKMFAHKNRKGDTLIFFSERASDIKMDEISRINDPGSL